MEQIRLKVDDIPHIKVLIIEDDDAHAALIRRTLTKAENISFDMERSGLLSAGFDLLAKKNFDVILSDLGLPDSNGLETFQELYARYPNVPVIVLTALDDENTALNAMHCGAQDYLVKDRIDTGQLTRSIRYSIERQKLLMELDKRLKEIKTLQGILPMCSWCRNIRDDKGYWKDLETYIQEHTDAFFSHGICPECAKKFYPEFCEKLQQKNPDIQEQGSKQDKPPHPDETL